MKVGIVTDVPLVVDSFRDVVLGCGFDLAFTHILGQEATYASTEAEVIFVYLGGKKILLEGEGCLEDFLGKVLLCLPDDYLFKGRKEGIDFALGLARAGRLAGVVPASLAAQEFLRDALRMAQVCKTFWYFEEKRTVSLTQREKQVLRQLALGASYKATAGALGISEPTVKNHVHNIHDKFGVSDTRIVVLQALALGLISLE